MPAVLSEFIISSHSLFLSHRNLERHVKKGMAIRMQCFRETGALRKDYETPPFGH